MPEMTDLPLTKKYFRKEIVTTPLFLKSGGRVPFEVVGGDTGILETEDAKLIEVLDVAVKRRMGGVVSITAEEFEELKKNPPAPRLKRSSLKPWGRQDNPPANQPREEDAAAVSQKTASIKVPDKEPMLAQLADLKRKSGKLGEAMDLAKKATA